MNHLPHHQLRVDQNGTCTARPGSHSSHARRLTRLVFAGAVAALALPGCKSKTTVTGPTAITSRAGLLEATNGVVIDSRGSQLVSGSGALVADDFTFTGSSTIKTVAWQGDYCSPITNAAAPTPNATAFRVSFFSDSSGRPKLSTPLSQVTYTLAQSAETLDRTTSGLTCTDGGSRTGTNVTFGLYRYQVTLTTPFAAAANTKYWIAVQAITPSFSLLWGWRDGVADNNLSLLYFNNTYVGPSTYDRAFALTP